MYTSFDNVGLLKVLNFLESHESEYLSGQDLSDVLKISRVAVWKHIEKIRSLGYRIDSKQKRGYKFVNRTERLLPWEITKKIKSEFVGRRIYYFDEIDSTQNYALQISKNKNEIGGLSGRPLFVQSTLSLKKIFSLTNGQILLIGVGGVSNGNECYEKIKSGANLIQLYTALIFQGPKIVTKIKNELVDLMKTDGFKNIKEVVGKDT